MNREALPACAGCSRRFHPEPGAPFICELCRDVDDQPPARQPWDVPLFPIGTDLPDAHTLEMRTK